MFKDTLLEIYNELNNHKRDRTTVISECIKDRLHNCNEAYKHSLKQSLDYLTNKNDLNIIKKVNKRAD